MPLRKPANAADLFGLQIKPESEQASFSRDLYTGKLADLVVLNADPLSDIANTQTIYLVVRDVKMVDPAALARRLADDG